MAQTFELYQLLVEEVRDARKARRDLSNVFTTMNLAGVGALGFLSKPDNGMPPALIAWMGGALILICIIWRTSNSYYTTMLKVKYDIIYEVEDNIGIDPLRREWRGLPRKGPPKWFSLERAMPWLFVVGYIVFLLYRISIDDVIHAGQAMRQSFADFIGLFRS